MDEKEKLDAIREQFEQWLSGFDLIFVGTHPRTGYRYLRFRRRSDSRRKGQSLRVEITENAIEDLSAEDIVSRVKEYWQQLPDEDDAALVAEDGVRRIDYYPYPSR